MSTTSTAIKGSATVGDTEERLAKWIQTAVIYKERGFTFIIAGIMNYGSAGGFG